MLRGILKQYTRPDVPFELLPKIHIGSSTYRMNEQVLSFNDDKILCGNYSLYLNSKNIVYPVIKEGRDRVDLPLLTEREKEGILLSDFLKKMGPGVYVMMVCRNMVESNKSRKIVVSRSISAEHPPMLGGLKKNKKYIRKSKKSKKSRKSRKIKN
jgi:hypothetical protein